MGGSYSLTCTYIDLDSSRFWRESLAEDISLSLLGGRGVGMHFLARNPTIKALDKDSLLIIAIGPLVGTKIPSSSRAVVSGISPLTNTVCSSAVGGRFALEMRKAGTDVICIAGRAKRRSVIDIRDNSVRIEEDRFPEDLPIPEITGRLASEAGSVAAVGEAALKGCLYASIMVDGSHASGRGGLGLVMASKNVRALIIKGSGPGVRKPAEARREDDARRDIIRLFDASPFLMGRSGISRYGTPALVDLIAERRMMPTANFRRTFFEGYRAFDAWAFMQTCSPKRRSCWGCPVACKQRSSWGALPEYETVAHFGALNENDDLESIITANTLCNAAGMDTISAASTIACLAEIKGERYRGDLLVDKVRSILDTTHEAELLRQGSAIMASSMGAPGASMSVKGLELPAYDPRGSYGMALAYGTSTRGGCHLRAYPIATEILRKPVATDRFSFEGKARMVKIAEDLCAAIDTIGACRFAFLGASLEEYAKAVSAVTGVSLSHDDLMRIGEAVYDLERDINAQRGFSEKDDLLPERFYTEPGTPGPDFDVPPIDKQSYLEALRRYYRIRSMKGKDIRREG